ncbi:hypothetical protein [Kurthia gibsonii]|uniref:hypothetical protein n=1 Tax=Kurthia gibsonii TaxID=33946 RepID=UPI0030198ADC
MVKTLVIYDMEGFVIDWVTGTYRNPVGVPSLEVEIPTNKTIKRGFGVDVSKRPHEVILEDIPPSEIDVLKSENEELKASQASQDELIMALMLGGA